MISKKMGENEEGAERKVSGSARTSQCLREIDANTTMQHHTALLKLHWFDLLCSGCCCGFLLHKKLYNNYASPQQIESAVEYEHIR